MSGEMRAVYVTVLAPSSNVKFHLMGVPARALAAMGPKSEKSIGAAAILLCRIAAESCDTAASPRKFCGNASIAPCNSLDVLVIDPGRCRASKRAMLNRAL